MTFLISTIASIIFLLLGLPLKTQSLPSIRIFDPSSLIACFLCGLLIPVVSKSPFSAILVVHMLETLIIDAQFKHVAMLHNVQHMRSNLKGILVCRTELLYFAKQLAVSVDFLFPAEVTAHELDSH